MGDYPHRYEVQLCAMKHDGTALTYCDASIEMPVVWSVYVKEYTGDDQTEIHEDEDYESKLEALARAEELIKKYGDCPFEEY